MNSSRIDSNKVKLKNQYLLTCLLAKAKKKTILNCKIFLIHCVHILIMALSYKYLSHKWQGNILKLISCLLTTKILLTHTPINGSIWLRLLRTMNYFKWPSQFWFDKETEKVWVSFYNLKI